VDPFVAEIRIFPFNFPPRGWAFCDGQILPISQNTALFSLLGTTYGGNGTSTFALPDLRGLAPNNMTYSICDQGIFPSRR
jgi:microcystin-dependent protein